MEQKTIHLDELPGIDIVITRDPDDGGDLPQGWLRLSCWDAALRGTDPENPELGLLSTGGTLGPGPL
ncbi:hypothetical protein [Williamsia sp.]|uniref:hypothetical protein n=1 Tax=Williamsia sp. TaxID=1872085 RepID=UPI002F944934